MSTTRVRVLIADDDPLVGDIAQVLLEEAGFAVQAVTSGAAALACCAGALPDIALLDVEMPDGDGYQTCAAIRAMPGGENVPIVMVTGLDDSTSIDHAYDVGATDFIVKPINWALLAHRIRYVLRGARTIEALRFSEQKNAAFIKAIPDGLYLLNTEGAIEHCFHPLDALSHPGAAARFAELLPPACGIQALQCLEGAVSGASSAFEFSLGDSSAASRHFECRYLPNARGRVLVIVRDVTARHQAESRIHRLAFFDTLTGLPNREWLGDFLAHALERAQRDQRSAGLLYVDLDQFKRINDTLGHDIGDELLRQVAGRVTDTLARLTRARPPLALSAENPESSEAPAIAAQLARVGGDEFIVVLTGDPTVAEAERVAGGIQTALSLPFQQGAFELVVTPSIGIAMYPEHGSDAASLLKNADGAMYAAKSSGRNQYRLYTSALNERAMKRLSLEMELRRALEESRLEVHYQPKFDARHLGLVGAEALLRWFDPQRGQIPTADFVAVAEETGLIADVGRWAMQQVCRDLTRWRQEGLSPPPVAVNLSGRDFMRPESLSAVIKIVQQSGLPASLLELELTEGVLMQDAEAGRRSLLALKEFGFSLAVDDFGTGYCSLNYLKRFPLDTLKIDRSFVQDITLDADDAAIVRAIIALGHSLDLKIVAEGVSTDAQLQFLRAEGCDAIQGYLMSAAVPATAYRDLIAARAPARLEIGEPGGNYGVRRLAG